MKDNWVYMQMGEEIEMMLSRLEGKKVTVDYYIEESKKRDKIATISLNQTDQVNINTTKIETIHDIYI